MKVVFLRFFCEKQCNDRIQVGLEEEEARGRETTCNRLEWNEVKWP